MKLKTFRNDFNIPSIGQGCMGLGGLFKSDYNNDQKCITSIQYGIDCGLTFGEVIDAV